MVYTVTLNPALDYYMHISELKSDVQLASKTEIRYGGKGINVSAILASLGVETTALGFVGGFTGEKLCKMLNESNIKADFVSVDGDTRINVKIDGASELIVNSNGPAITLKDEQKLIEKIGKINNDDYLVLAGSIPSSMGSLAYNRIIDNAQNKDFKLVVDTSGEAFKNALSYNPWLVKPNNFELEEILNRKLNTRDDFVFGAKQLQKMGAKNVLVSLGKQGMILLTENGDLFDEPIIDGEVKNTTGCGDSTVAGFIAGYIKCGDYSYALKLANACANATAFSEKLATKDEIMRLMK